jgi:Tol biopolymer transport system component
MIGQDLGPYRVLEKLGAGGMGEVYKARDTRLQRDVAVKVLPTSVAHDPEQRARFERETRAVAALSHPNVLAIFDTGSHEGDLYAVTELLQGETLRDRLKSGAVPLRKALDWAVELACGLAAAHDKQLVHRDLKPENIFVLDDGRVKILDFGLARQMPATAADGTSETMADLTAAGAVVGTVGYMAPEQVRGHAVDVRADLFALGAVLYEMLTGRRAFRRATAAETMTAILNEDPPEFGTEQAGIPLGLERIVRHCLEKNVNERFQTARDIAFAIEGLRDSGAAVSRGQAMPPPAAGSVARRRGFVLIGAAGVAGALLIAWFAMSRLDGSREDGRGAPPIVIGASTQVTTDDGLEIHPALSPDGKLLAYAAGTATEMRIYIRPVGGGRTLTLSESGQAFEYEPRWSPDGSQILFLRRDGVFVASALGGTSRRVAGGPITAAAWAADGRRVLIARASTLTVAPLEGGSERALASGEPEVHSCAWSPLDDWVACVSGNGTSVVPGGGFGNVAPSAIVMAPASGGSFVTVADRTAANLSPAWSPDGHALYFVSNREGPRDIYVVDVDGDRGVQDAARRVTTGLGVQSIAFAATGGRLAYVGYVARANIWSLPISAGAAIDTSGAQALTSGSQIVESLRISRDQKWVVFDSTLHLNAEVFRMPVGGGPAERLTTHPADDFAADLAPNGQAVAYHSWRSGSRDIYVQPLDGGPTVTITATPGQESSPIWSADGRAIAFVDLASRKDGDALGKLWLVRQDAQGGWGTPVFVGEDVNARGAWVDERTLVYPRNGALEAIPLDGGAARVVYAPAPGSADPHVRSVATSDGRTLYFKSGGAESQSGIWAVTTAGGKPRLVVRFADPARPSIRSDFAVGAGRFFFTLEDRQADIWVAEVARSAPP